MSAPTLERERLRELALRAGEELEDASALEIMAWTAEQFGSSWCVASLTPGPSTSGRWPRSSQRRKGPWGCRTGLCRGSKSNEVAGPWIVPRLEPGQHLHRQIVRG